MRILILDTDNRDIISLIYHYNVLGHEPCVPAPGTLGYQFSPLWPRVLFKDYHNRKKRIIDNINFENDISEVSKFGEDRFVTKNWIEENPVYKSDIGLSFVDIENEGDTFDAWHSTPNAKSSLPIFMELSKKYFPKAKWITSSVDHFDHNILNCKNVIKWLPANYAFTKFCDNENYFFRHPFEFEYLNVKISNENIIEYDNKRFSSFNHNFSVRHPVQYDTFVKVNEKLKNIGRTELIVKNYGGNIRKHGADIKFSENLGITGKFMTLSPQDAMKTYISSCGVLHLKQYDWSGGVPAGCRISGCPIIIQSSYVEATKSENYFINGYNCVYADSIQEIVNTIIKFSEDDEFRSKISINSKKMNDDIFCNDYWRLWNEFLEKLE
jgi:hypothetical protein